MRFRQVMIGDDQVDANAPRGLGRLKGADAGVHADDHFYARRRGPFDDIIFDSVAFFDPVGDVEVSRAAAKLNRGLQDDDSSRSIDIVVAINQDAFLIGDGCAQALDGGGHAAHEIGRMKLVERRRQEICRALLG